VIADDLICAAIDVADDGMRGLGWSTRAVNLEPCVMCIGAAMTLGVDEVIFGLESPGDGGASLATRWVDSAGTPFFRAPRIVGGIRRGQVQAQFRRYTEIGGESRLKAWAPTFA
jgi:tRNA(adenine34) deaminase